MRRGAIVAALALAATAEVWALTTVFSDTFTSGSTVELSTHTPDTGTSWGEIDDSTGSLSFSNSTNDYVTATASGTSARVVYAATPNPALGSANYDVTATMLQFQTGQSDDDSFFLVARADGTFQNGYGLALDANSTTQAYLFKRVSGTFSVISNSGTKSNHTHQVNDRWKLSVRGDTVRGYVDAAGGGSFAEVWCVVDADVSAAGSAGIGAGIVTTGTADVSPTWRVDDFLVEDATSDGGDDNCGGGAPRNGFFWWRAG